MNANGGRTQTWRYALREHKALTFGQRNAVLERYGRKCAICGFRCGLEVHHIEGEALEPAKAQYNDQKNLIPLCSSCHHASTGLELYHIVFYRLIVMPYLKRIAESNT